MHSVSEQAVELEAESGKAGALPLPEEALAAVDNQALARLVRMRLKKFTSLLPRLLLGEDPESVHDVRVWSRRLQQSLVAPFPKPRPARVRRLRGTLRGVRRSLGEWRNCDVLLELIAREYRRTRSQAKRDAWELLRHYLLEKRGRQIAVARQKLFKQGLGDFIARVERMLENPGERDQALTQPLRASVEAARAQWQSTLARAQETRQAADVHMFRIATKRLRYRIELLYDLGDKRTRPLLNSLKKLQEALGVWHDRQTLCQAIAEALARPDFLVRESKAAQILLAQLGKGVARQATAVDEILCLVGEHSGLGPLQPKPASDV